MVLGELVGAVEVGGTAVVLVPGGNVAGGLVDDRRVDTGDSVLEGPEVWMEAVAGVDSVLGASVVLGGVAGGPLVAEGSFVVVGVLFEEGPVG